MKTVIIVCHNWDKAKTMFYQMMTFFGDQNVRCDSINLKIELKNIVYQLISQHDIDRRLRGLRIDQIIIDEIVDMTDDQRAFLQSRLINGSSSRL